MAQAFFEKYSPENEVQSAGYSSRLLVGRTLEMTQFVKICMDEEGIDVRSKIPRR
jgi:protein-tyrosine-phosphatase